MSLQSSPHPKDILAFMHWVAIKLRRAEREKGAYRGTELVKFDKTHLQDLWWPPNWVREARDSCTRQEYLIRYARAVGLHAFFNTKEQMCCRLTRDRADEAAITWPGKRRDDDGRRQEECGSAGENQGGEGRGRPGPCEASTEAATGQQAGAGAEDG